ncbi:MAG: hypothetical protein IPH28_02360 [Cytophagaceae bacterium]|nr:hypothetical protein [Cytophagaceae bacterium]MBK9511977.1 hypothetical protein [Cytophagaceae bacterium]MBK9934923.1 hypothetical protein [Cytophagaceae bacterium]MBL0301361.1 hypothetical protein [Cytophagaceae bacterium]MBL0324180.1 hypothetical protein [Cytophagaceae bacterium]
MERIVLEVGDTTAKKWRFTSQKRREEIAKKIEINLAKELMNESKEEFKMFLTDLRDTMKNNGLTEEALSEILKDNDE